MFRTQQRLNEIYNSIKGKDCGEVTITREAIYLTATCNDCGEIAIVTYMDPIDEDSTKCIPSGPLA